MNNKRLFLLPTGGVLLTTIYSINRPFYFGSCRLIHLIRIDCFFPFCLSILGVHSCIRFVYFHGHSHILDVLYTSWGFLSMTCQSDNGRGK